MYKLLDVETKVEMVKFYLKTLSMLFFDFWSKSNLWQNRYHLKALFTLITMVQVPASYDLPSLRYGMKCIRFGDRCLEAYCFVYSSNV